jgi:hypothetical protein
VTPGRHALAQGFAPDARFATPSDLTIELLRRLDAAGHGDRPLWLRRATIERGRGLITGVCLAVAVMGEDGSALEHGFAYLFLPNIETARAEMLAALEPHGYVPVRRSAHVIAFPGATERARA